MILCTVPFMKNATTKQDTVHLLCSICCQIYFALFILMKVEVQKKEQNKFDNKLNIKHAQWNEILCFQVNLKFDKVIMRLFY